MSRKDPHYGDVFAFKAGRVWVPCQVVRCDGPWLHIMVYDTTSAKRPKADVVEGAPFYVAQSVPPKGEPMFFMCDYGPPAECAYLGNRTNRLAFDLPETFRLGRETESLPTLLHWVDALDRVRGDMAKPRPPYRSKTFPKWKIDPRAMRAIDDAVKGFAAHPAPYQLRMAIRAADHWKDEIDAERAEQLRAKLLSITERVFVRNAEKILRDEPKW